MSFIEHRLGRTHFTTKGKATDRLPVIWLHGGPGGMHNPNGNLFSLSENRKVYAYTQLGSGRSSDLSKRQWRISTFVQELQALVAAWGLKDFHLMGGSWGTTLALEYYLKVRGKGIRSMVLQSPMLSAADWQQDANRLIKALPKETQRVIQYCQAVGATDSMVYQDALALYYSRHVLRRPKKLKAMLARKNPRGAAIYQHMWGHSEFSATGTLAAFDQTHRLQDIDCPTLIVCGEHDEATPKTGARYAKRLPKGYFQEIAGASHAIWEEQPTRLKARINDFIQQWD
ncbi:MAG: proline iminopeptidase [Candidatus Azotimanducaceae bacterium]|jgi:proline iminopeptidase|tara:strand:- start:2631 stop:3488 length:858 start_codon:yes stop_codon:yes gene_type:complete